MIILLTGLPGVGKTEVARMLQKRLPNSVIIRNDEIRKELFGVVGGKGFHEDQDAPIEAAVNEKIRVAVKNGQDVIVDRLSATTKKIKLIRNLAIELHAKFALIFISSDEHLIEKRINERLTKDPLGVPFEVYLYWKKQYEIPTAPDYSIVNNEDLSALEKKVRDILQHLQ